MHSLQDKVALVTGGADGIGASIVKRFLKEGAKVVILDINDKLGSGLAEEMAGTYGEDRVQFINCDVSQEEQLLSTFERVNNHFGSLDVVVNNAGIADETFPMYQKQIAINFTGVIASTLRAMDMMRRDKGGKGGTIINVSSVLALNICCSGLFVYGATKSGLIHFGTSIGMEEYYSRTNVRVLTICYGMTNTAILTKAKSFDPETHKKFDTELNNSIVRKNMQSGDDAANGMVECFKNGISGSTWIVDSGRTKDISSKVTKAFDILYESAMFIDDSK